MARRVLIEVLLLAVAAAAIGLAANAIRRDSIPSRLPEAFYRLESGAKPLMVEGAKRLYDRGGVFFVDARPADEYERMQIEGALNVPFESWSARIGELEGWLGDQDVVVYSDPERITNADDLAAVLRKRGYPGALFVYIEGIDAWREAGLPLTTGPDPVFGSSNGDEGDEEDDWPPRESHAPAQPDSLPAAAGDTGAESEESR
ncbi:MAG: rhodanese-like domain-containing protein [Candidatus Eisenbacteria bacterium]|nr:rhodanese-like domain-containing protein [Candidatus Eisenbacteria bacterium]